MPRAYYNEHDPHAAAWLENLIAAGAIAPGDVDRRDIRDVRPADLAGYDQCHFFAGIGVWSFALRSAGWGDDRPVWTGSCPCQPWSSAGRGAGFDDERHLWPHWHWLISERRPETVFGEQVASSDGLAWLDLVSADLEGSDYAVGAVDTCAAGFGAPHIRQRLYFAAENLRPAASRVEHAERKGLEGHCWHGDGGREPGWLDALPHRSVAQAGAACGLADARRSGDESYARPEVVSSAEGPLEKQARERERRGIGDFTSGASSGLADCDNRSEGLDAASSRSVDQWSAHVSRAGSRRCDGALHPGPTNGFWRDADWLGCRDGKWRPVEPDTFPLAHGSAARVGRLRAYGNGLVAAQAAAFIRAYDERAMGAESAVASSLFEWGA